MVEVFKKVLKIISITIAIAGAVAAVYFFVVKVIEKLQENRGCGCGDFVSYDCCEEDDSQPMNETDDAQSDDNTDTSSDNVMADEE